MKDFALPPAVTVILCTFNPRSDYLDRTLAALARQTLPTICWEILLIDNASSPAVQVDLSWHPSARVIREEEIGLTAARLRGIAAARAELLVFVDDDNLLHPDYLSTALALAETSPKLGVWGCGDFTPEWESPPPAGFEEYLRYLAVHKAARDRWSDKPFDYEATPAGAGLCVRTSVARHYAATVAGDLRHKQLGRLGDVLSGCEDFDLAFTAIDLGLATGVFTKLALTHLIPRTRVMEPYLLRLIEGHASSTVRLHFLRDPNFSPPKHGLLDRIRAWRWQWKLKGTARKIYDAHRRGERAAWAAILATGSDPS